MLNVTRSKPKRGRSDALGKSVLFFAAPLFFAPHYSITHSAASSNLRASPALVSDFYGNAYFFAAAEDGRWHLNKFDADGHLAYDVEPVSGAFYGALIVPDENENVYLAVLSLVASRAIAQGHSRTKDHRHRGGKGKTAVMDIRERGADGKQARSAQQLSPIAKESYSG